MGEWANRGDNLSNRELVHLFFKNSSIKYFETNQPHKKGIFATDFADFTDLNCFQQFLNEI